MRVLHRRQPLAVTFAGHDGAQNLLTRLARYIGDDGGELDVHLGERLLHVLDALGTDVSARLMLESLAIGQLMR